MSRTNKLGLNKKLAVAVGGAILTTMATGSAANNDRASNRVEQLIAQMTLEEKVAMLHGGFDPDHLGSAGYIPGVARLGIPALRLSDGPAGIRLAGHQATSMPAPIAMAASFSSEIAREMGQTTGVEGKALNQDVLLSPMLNIVRVPQAGRNFETLGEDPLLAATLVAAQITGIQEKGLIATAKHYVANNQEDNRMALNATIDQRSLHEIYLPAFKAAVDANVGAIMCAYNGINGKPACENSELLDDVLRKDWGFTGFVMSDWGATNSTKKALQAGLDMEMPFGHFFADPLITAVKNQDITESTVDQSVRRILQQMAAFNLLDEQAATTIDKSANAASAKKIALAGAVLLKNQGSTLPLTTTLLSKAAIIGPAAKIAIIGGGGSSQVDSFTKVSPLNVFKSRTGNDSLAYQPGINLQGEPIPASYLIAEDGISVGLTMYQGTGNNKTLSTIEPQLNHVGNGKQIPASQSRTWLGYINVPVDGSYDINLQTLGGQGVLLVDGEQVADTAALFAGYSLLSSDDGLHNASTTLNLTAGLHSIEVQGIAGKTNFFQPPGDTPLDIRLSWVTPTMQQAAIASAVDAAKTAAANNGPAIVFAYNEGTEGADRKSLALPNRQDALIAAVQAVNPRTIVVLNTGDPVTMPWLGDVQAVLEMWYSGQEGAEATADLLLGVANPSGRLPVTFPKSLTDIPATEVTAYPGENNEQSYREGIFVGYRWYQTQNIEPLFPFGHGLSYSTFTYANQQVAVNADGGYQVSFTVTNSGVMAGADVPQLYLGAPDNPPVPMAAKSLVGFTRVELGSGESTMVKIDIAPQAFKYWSESEQTWRAAMGKRDLYLGHSVSDLQSIARISASQ